MSTLLNAFCLFRVWVFILQYNLLIDCRAVNNNQLIQLMVLSIII